MDYENNTEDWWYNAHRCGRRIPQELRPLFETDDVQDVYVSQDRWHLVRDWCVSIPGWLDGPEHAPTPLIFYKETDK
jgi:hypothetical protein